MANVRLRVGIVGLKALVLVGVLLSPQTLGAQPQGQDEDAPPPWVQLSVVQVDPARVAEFMAVQRELMDLARDGDTYACHRQSPKRKRPNLPKLLRIAR